VLIEPFPSWLAYCTDLPALIEAKEIRGDKQYTNVLGVDDGKNFLKVRVFLSAIFALRNRQLPLLPFVSQLIILRTAGYVE
jgi:hypothetical protein